MTGRRVGSTRKGERRCSRPGVRLPRAASEARHLFVTLCDNTLLQWRCSGDDERTGAETPHNPWNQ